MSTDVSELRELLAGNGYHVTKAREVIFNLLVSPEPQTMAQIITKAKGRVDRVSIYRNIDLFEKLGIVNRIYVGWKYKLELSDQFMHHHHHLSCISCGAVTDINDEAHINEFINSVAKAAGFTPRSHQFEIEGYCKSCSD